MSQFAALLRPVFNPLKPGNIDLLLKEWLDYVKMFKNFLKATGEVGDHTEGHVTYGMCVNGITMLRLIGGREVEILLDYMTAMIEDGSLEEGRWRRE